MSPLVVWTVVALVIIPIIALSVYAVVDLARRDDVPAGRKAAWIAAVAFVPLLGGGLYLIFRPMRPEDIRGFGRRRRQQQQVQRLLGNEDDAAREEDGAV